MKNLWSKVNFILITFLLIISVISPVLGTGIVINEDHSYLNDLELNANELPNFNSNRATN